MYYATIFLDSNFYIIFIKNFQDFVRSGILVPEFAGFRPFQQKYVISRFKGLRMGSFVVVFFRFMLGFDDVFTSVALYGVELCDKVY